jgi:hypothetical protein
MLFLIKLFIIYKNDVWYTYLRNKNDSWEK